MNVLSRYIFQVLLWLGVWLVLWISNGSQLPFISANAPAFLFQVFLLFGLIYYAVPQFLFKKKYVVLLLCTIPIIIAAAYISAELGPAPPMDRPPLSRGIRPPPDNVPSRFFIHFLVIFLSCVTAVLLEIFIDAQKKEREFAFAKAELIETELKLLKMQINPHFLFNALNNIYALSVTDSDKTQERISTLSEMLRYVIYDCEQPKVPLRKELDYIQNYIELFKLKSSKPFNIELEIDVDDKDILVAPMLFIPYIENAFKHSGVEKGADNFVHIALVQSNDQINFTVENGNRETPVVTDAQGGIGLPNVQKRLELLYPGLHQLEITATDVFRVHLILNTP